MNTLKQLNEKLGEARKRKADAVNQRASKLSKLEAQMNGDGGDEETIEALKEDIRSLKADIEKENGMIEMYTDQLADLSEVETYDTDGFQGFHPGGDAPSKEDQELANFKFVKAFRQKLNGEPLTGLEKELHQEAITEANRSGANLEGNLHIPQKVLTAKSKFNQFRNDLSVTGGTGGDAGGTTVETDLRSLIDILKAKLVFTGDGGLGATFFSNLTGDIEFPRAIEDAANQAVKAETAPADELSPTFSSLLLSPQRLPAFTEVTRQLLNQSSVDIESWLRNYLMYKLAKTMNINIINDILANGNVSAIENGVDGGALDWPQIVAFETAIANADADEPMMGWLMNPKVRGILKTSEKAAGQAAYLWDRENLVNGYRAIVSTLVPGDLTKGTGTDLSAAIFGNWASLYIAQWGGFDFLVNPYSRDTEGIIRINAWTFFDNGLRHPESFAVAQDITTT